MQSSDSTTLFTTARLRVRPLVDSDADVMLSVYGDADAMRWVGDGRPITPEDCLRWIEKTHRNYRERGYGMSAMVLLDTDAVIGFCGLVHPGDQPTAEIKYALSRAYWRHGYATEAARGMLKYATQELGVHEVIATIAEEHAASQRVAQKCGLRPITSRQEDDGSRTLVFGWSTAGSVR